MLTYVLVLFAFQCILFVAFSCALTLDDVMASGMLTILCMCAFLSSIYAR